MSAEALLRVIIADDDPFARRVIKGALQAAGVTVVAEAKDGQEAVELALHYRPDVVIMDVVMPELDGILGDPPDPHAARPAHRGAHRRPSTSSGSWHSEAGAVGFLSKDVDIDALPRALEGVRRGEAAISREMTRRSWTGTGARTAPRACDRSRAR